MSYFSLNMEVLGVVDGGLHARLSSVKLSDYYQAVAAQNGSPILKIGGKAVHSTYNPESEAEKWVEAVFDHENRYTGSEDNLVVGGFGFGYHIPPLLRRIKKRPLAVYEPRIEVIRAAFEHINLKPLLQDIRFFTSFPQLMNEYPDAVILRHPGSHFSSYGWFDAVEGYTNLRRMKTSLKIMIISPIYGGSLPITWYCKEALEEDGHVVNVVDFSAFKGCIDGIDKNVPGNKNYFYGRMSSMLSEIALIKAAEFSPHIVLSMAQAPLELDAVAKMRQAGMVTAFWFVEDYTVMEYWKNTAPAYDHFFILQEGHFEKALKDAGAENFHYLPLAASPSVHKPSKLAQPEAETYKSDISFVGAGYLNRRRFFQQLLNFDFKIWGNEWERSGQLEKIIQKNGARIPTEETTKIFNATRININLHSSNSHSGINPFGDYLNPRVFEIASCGAFQLMDDRSYLAKHFVPGKEIITFADIDDLKEKINYYLARPEEAKRIADAAKIKTMAEHTYKCRMREMLGLLCSKNNKLLYAMSGKEKVSDMLEKANGDKELIEFLSEFNPEDKITLDDIVSKIRSSKGELTKTEARFLLLKELINIK